MKTTNQIQAQIAKLEAAQTRIQDELTRLNAELAAAKKATKKPATKPATTEQKILNISGNGRNKISDIKKALTDIDNKEIDRALQAMCSSNTIWLGLMEDPMERTQDDNDLAMQLNGGMFQRHLFYVN